MAAVTRRAARGAPLLENLLLLLVVGISALIAWAYVSAELTLQWQAALGAFTIVLGAILLNLPGHGGGRIGHLMMVIAALTTTRYLYWRITETLPIGEGFTKTDLGFALVLLAAESYAWTILFLGFLQSAWPLRRKPTPLPDDFETWPSVDIYIPTYNEPLEVIRPTVLAALDVDWPESKLNVYVLDDGRREELGKFCARVGVTHLTRPDNLHAKAGNINAALARTDGELIAIFDCDHVPTRSFLQITVGTMVADPNCAMVQTPHHFFSPDPFERNLNMFRRAPNEGELFYGVLQDGNDYWDATFFCGSCAVLRRTALEEIGGIAVETVTEDAHTSLKMHRRGWSSAYINIPQAAGLATESLSVHVGQRIRWARGMAQIFRIDNPLLGRGLKLGQRLCYFSAMMHFFFGFPRLVFLTAPIAYLLFDAKVIAAQGVMIVAFAIPHLVLAIMTNSRLHGRYRQSFWAEVYETVLALFIIIPTLVALYNPKAGKFNVTQKGGLVTRDYFDKDIATPYLFLYMLAFSGIVAGVVRLLWGSPATDTVVINMLWTVYNLIILGAALCVASEQKQVRRAARIDCKVPVLIRRPDDRTPYAAETTDLSYLGAAMTRPPELSELELEQPLEIALIPDRREVWIPATVKRVQGGACAVQFGEMEPEEEQQLVYALYGRANAWMRWREPGSYDKPLKALFTVTGFGLLGAAIFWRWLWSGFVSIVARPFSRRRAVATATVMLLFPFAMLLGTEAAAQQHPNGIPHQIAQSKNGTRSIDLELLGVQSPIRLRSTYAQFSVPVSVRRDQVVTRATLNLQMSHSPGLLPDRSNLSVLYNGEVIDTWPLLRENSAGDRRTIEIDPNLFVTFNQLRFELVAGYARDECEDPTHPTLWAQISNRSTLDVELAELSVPPDLGRLPAPFFEQADGRRLRLPIVLGTDPGLQSVQAGAVIASWFGMLADYRGAEFPVRIGSLPDNSHAIVLRSNPGDVPALDNLPIPEEPEIRVVNHPDWPSLRLLVISARAPSEVLRAARALVYGDASLSGRVARVDGFELPDPLDINASPRWQDPSKPVPLGRITNESLSASGYYPPPIGVDFRLPPDLLILSSNGPELRYDIRSATTSRVRSTLSVMINGHFAGDDRLREGMLRSETVHRRMQLPSEVISHRNRLTWNFNFTRDTTEYCEAFNPDMLQGSISPEATLHFPRHTYYARMPELSLFAEGGFPFGRRPDGASTAFVIPAAFDSDDLSALFTLAGHLSHQTGVPLLHARVHSGLQMPPDLDRDLLIVGGAERLGLMAEIADVLPLQFRNGMLTLRRNTAIERWLSMAEGRDLDGARTHAGRVIHDGGAELGAMMGAASPWGRNRSLVVVTAGARGNVSDVTRALINPGKVGFFGGDLTLVRGDDISSYSIGTTYGVGRLPWDHRVREFLGRFPILMIPLLLLVAVFLAFLLRYLLQRRAGRRLNGSG